MVRLTRPEIGEEEIRAVTEVLRSGMLVQGERVRRFEVALAERAERAHAVAVSSGTSALHLSLLALEVGPEDEVLCPDLTWPSPAHAIALCGARPVLVDVCPDEWNARPEAYAAARTARTRVALVIDQFGFPARHREIAKALPGLLVLEDAACALGSRIGGRPAGSFGALACLSFHPRKLLTTGEGGACLTDDDALATRLRTLRNHGQVDGGRFTEAAGNHRMTELAAALGLVQLERLDRMVAARRDRARRYREARPDLRWQRPAPGAEPNVQTLGVILPDGAPDRDEVLATLRADGVEAGLLSYALHTLPSLGAPGGAFPHTEEIARRGIALPLFSTMTDEAQTLVIDALRAILPPAP